MLPGLCGEDTLLRVQPRRRGDAHDLARCLGQHLLVRTKPGRGLLLAGLASTLGIHVADRAQRETGDPGECLEVVPADPAAADQRESKRGRRGHEVASTGAMPPSWWT